MRVVRFPPRPHRVSDDVRAALASLGRGGDVVGGVALLGVTPPDSELEIDAVLVLPRGVLAVVGVDLPDPAIRLAAPLTGEWRADGWPLVRPDDSTPNPGVDALAVAGRLADRLHALDPSVGLGVIVAVGPYVETVEQPPGDLAGPVRIVYPSATSFLAATEALPSRTRPLTTDQVRAVLADLAPTATEFDDTVLIEEGFALPTVEAPTPPPPQAPKPRAPALRPAPDDPSAARIPVDGGSGEHVFESAAAGATRRRTAGLLAAAVIVVAVVIAIVVGIVGTPESTAPVAGTTASAPSTIAEGVTFTTVADDRSGQCLPDHAVGDIQVFFARHSCSELHRASFTTVVGEHRVAVSVADVTFSGDDVAGDFVTLADTPGTGVVTDVGEENSRWPAPEPGFEHPAYLSARDGATVRLVLTDAVSGPPPTADPAQQEAARAALALVLD